MENFDKQMALEVIEDALTDLDTPHGRGMATGLCGAFHLSGLITEEEWITFLKRIQVESGAGKAAEVHKSAKMH